MQDVIPFSVGYLLVCERLANAAPIQKHLMNARWNGMSKSSGKVIDIKVSCCDSVSKEQLTDFDTGGCCRGATGKSDAIGKVSHAKLTRTAPAVFTQIALRFQVPSSSNP
jgi:hypothetical protein